MRTCVVAFVTIATALTLSARTATAQTYGKGKGPSAEETAKWLHNALQRYATITYQTHWNFAGPEDSHSTFAYPTELSVDNCRINATFRTSSTGRIVTDVVTTNVDSTVTKVKVQLATLDPLSVRISELPIPEGTSTPSLHVVSAESSSTDKTVFYDMLNLDGTTTRMNSGIVQFTGTDRLLGKRIVEALKYYIELCGGKVSPF